MPNHKFTDPDPAVSLTVVAQQTINLPAPDRITDAIYAQLDALHADGADPGRLDDIAVAARDLTAQAEHLHDLVHNVLEAGRTIREQRDRARAALVDFKRAVSMIDTDVPEVEELYQAAEEVIWNFIEEQDKNHLLDAIVAHTGLDDDEAHALYRVLTGNGPAPDNPLWDEVRDWLRHVRNNE